MAESLVRDKRSAVGAERLSDIWREVWVRAKFLDSVNTFQEATVCQVLSHNASFQGRWHQSYFTKAQRHDYCQFFFKTPLPPRVSFSPLATKPYLSFNAWVSSLFKLKVTDFCVTMSCLLDETISLSLMVLLIPQCVSSVQPRADIQGVLCSN